MTFQRQITILGATGSIGQSTLDVVARHPERFAVFALTAHQGVDRLFLQLQQHRPRYAVVADEAAAAALARRCRAQGVATEILAGPAGLSYVATHPEADTVMAAIVGAAGLAPTLAAASAGKRVLLANKEALVLAGVLMTDAVRQAGATLLPIDSEHNAIFQCLPVNFPAGLDQVGVSRIILTASGGPFLTWSPEQLAAVTPAQAVAHPKWSMGRKISVDSATLMNKGLEVIEAHWLFQASADHIEVVIHPQSVVHSLVQYVDGSVLAQLGNPDMRTPIAHALAYPERIASGVPPLSLLEVARMDFAAPDLKRFPCLRLAFDALRAGGTAPAVLNAANEVAVAAFLDGRIPFLSIAAIVEDVLSLRAGSSITGLDDVLLADAEARRLAAEYVVSTGY